MLLLLAEFVKRMIERGRAPTAPSLPVEASPPAIQPKKVEHPMITIKEYLTASGKYPEREKLGAGVLSINAEILLKKVNAFLDEIGWHEPVKVSSGFRPPAANAAAGGASKSGHLVGLAVDLVDTDGALKDYIRRDGGNLLRKHGLMMERAESTPGWLHLDIIDRKDRPNREFMP